MIARVDVAGQVGISVTCIPATWDGSRQDLRP
jgi:hypothetical protein